MNKKTILIVAGLAAVGVVIYFLMRKRAVTSAPSQTGIQVSTPKPVQFASFTNPVGQQGPTNFVNVGSAIGGLFSGVKNLFSSPASSPNTTSIALSAPSGSFLSGTDVVQGNFDDYTSSLDNLGSEGQLSSDYFDSYTGI